MDAGLQHNRLETVSTLAATLADRLLMERVTRGALPSEQGSALWIASLLLEECEHPVPDIVTDVLAQFRYEASTDDDAMLKEPTGAPSQGMDGAGRPGRLSRLFRSARPDASA